MIYYTQSDSYKKINSFKRITTDILQIIQINTKMLSQSSIKNKQNIRKTEQTIKEGSGLLQATVTAFKQEISTLQQDKLQMQREWVEQVDQLKLQLNEYKKKLAMVTDKFLLQTFTRDKHSKSPKKNQDYQQLLRQHQILLDNQRQNRKKVEVQLYHIKEQNTKLKKQICTLKLQKQKCMQISLIQKIDLEQWHKLFEEQLKSKKKIILSLKKELDKIYFQKEDLNKKERVIEQKSKQLDCYSKEINQYNRLNELKMKQQIGQLNKQNQFLKGYVKKIQKLAKKECDCESKQQKVRQNLYEIKRELALAKVKLSQNYQSQTKLKKKPLSSQSSDNQSNYSFQHKKK